MLDSKFLLGKTKNLLFYLFLISIFLFKIPNFYIFIFFKNPFFTSQALARLLIVINFLFNTYLYLMKKNKNFLLFKNKKLINFILIFFIIQSFSIFSAINLGSFLSRYKDIVISLLFFVSASFYKNKFKKIVLVLLLGTLLNIIFQFIIVARADFFIEVVSGFIYQKHLDYVLANLDRNRIYIDTFDEIMVPFLFSSFIVKRPFVNILAKACLILITVFSLLSNFRTRILMVFFL